MNRLEHLREKPLNIESYPSTPVKNYAHIIPLNDRIRALLDLGYCAADIARTLGITVDRVQLIELDQEKKVEVKKTEFQWKKLDKENSSSESLTDSV